MNAPIPVLRLQLDHMQHTLTVAMHEYALRLDEDLKAAIEAFCTPEDLRRVISAEVDRVLDVTIREEVKHFFQYGEDGRKIMAEAVKAKLLEGTTYTPLDKAP